MTNLILNIILNWTYNGSNRFSKGNKYVIVYEGLGEVQFKEEYETVYEVRLDGSLKERVIIAMAQRRLSQYVGDATVVPKALKGFNK